MFIISGPNDIIAFETRGYGVHKEVHTAKEDLDIRAITGRLHTKVDIEAKEAEAAV